MPATDSFSAVPYSASVLSASIPRSTFVPRAMEPLLELAMRASGFRSTESTNGTALPAASRESEPACDPCIYDGSAELQRFLADLDDLTIWPEDAPSLIDASDEQLHAMLEESPDLARFVPDLTDEDPFEIREGLASIHFDENDLPG